MTRATAEAPPGTERVPTGNAFDKYGSRNPLVRVLMDRFDAGIDGLWDAASPHSVLDVGCGEGVLALRFAERLGDRRVVGIDLDDPKLRRSWDRHSRSNLEYRTGDAASLPFADREFDLVAAIELLEHVPDFGAVLAEMVRVARRHLLVSVPREPLWRALNIARGAYWRSRGNTPGHVNHWSKRSFLSLLERYGSVAGVCSPPPWTMVLVRV